MRPIFYFFKVLPCIWMRKKGWLGCMWGSEVMWSVALALRIKNWNQSSLINFELGFNFVVKVKLGCCLPLPRVHRKKEEHLLSIGVKGREYVIYILGWKRRYKVGQKKELLASYCLGFDWGKSSLHACRPKEEKSLSEGEACSLRKAIIAFL